MVNNHLIQEQYLRGQISHQSVLDEWVNQCYPSPNDFTNWPPKIPTKDEVEKECQGIMAWLTEHRECQLFKYSDMFDLAGSSGYVARKDGNQISVFTVFLS